MKIYIAGPMTDLPLFNFNNFDAALARLHDAGHDCFSPADHDRKLLGVGYKWYPDELDTVGPWRAWKPGRFKRSPTLRQMLGADLAYICKEADAIYMLKGWEKSLGARAEHTVATCLGLQIIYE